MRIACEAIVCGAGSRRGDNPLTDVVYLGPGGRLAATASVHRSGNVEDNFYSARIVAARCCKPVSRGVPLRRARG